MPDSKAKLNNSANGVDFVEEFAKLCTRSNSMQSNCGTSASANIHIRPFSHHHHPLHLLPPRDLSSAILTAVFAVVPDLTPKPRSERAGGRLAAEVNDHLCTSRGGPHRNVRPRLREIAPLLGRFLRRPLKGTKTRAKTENKSGKILRF